MTDEQINGMQSVTEASEPRPTAGSQRPTAMSVAVAIPAYTMDRWSLLTKAVASLRAQTVPVDEIVLCIDNNDELLQRARDEWKASEGTPVRVIANLHSEHLSRVSIHEAAHGTKRRFGAGSARNTAAESVTSEIIAFMDDDAHAEPDWIEALLRVFERPLVVAVGGPPVPDYETARPSWYPGNFDWVFGCAYDGLPTTVSPLRHLIGANMAVRRGAWEAVGGFVGSDFDDLNLCMRLTARFGLESVVYTPFAVVHHFVSADRVTWRYFWRRCYFVNRRKVRVLSRIGSAANLVAEREFVIHALTAQARRTVSELARGRFGAVRVLAAMIAGISLAGLGHIRGRIDQLAGRWQPGRAA
jgi:cellulose synthase/poly-beta-1,6-N-acetylglucosamine synthase-like glycosyltransferase